MPRTVLTALLTKGPGSVTVRTQRSISWGLVGLLVTSGLALMVREMVLYDTIGAKATKVEVHTLERELMDYRAESRAVHERLLHIEQMQVETRNDVKQLLKEMK